MLSTNGTTRNPPGQDNGPRSHFINRGFAPSVSVPSVKSFSLVPFLFSSFCEMRIAPVLVVGREKMKTCGETRLHVPDYLITISDQCKSGARLRASCSIMPWPVFLPDSSLSLQYSSIWSFRSSVALVSLTLKQAKNMPNVAPCGRSESTPVLSSPMSQCLHCTSSLPGIARRSSSAAAHSADPSCGTCTPCSGVYLI